MKLICANFKMNLLKKDIFEYLKVLERERINDNVIFFPSSIHLNYFNDKKYLIGCQNISFKNFGSVTGDTSILQLKELGISYTLIGHSERRKYYNDNNYISDKVELALKNNIKSILCIGENLDEKDTNQTLIILKKEIDEALKNNLENITNDNFIIAYEQI